MVHENIGDILINLKTKEKKTYLYSAKCSSDCGSHLNFGLNFFKMSIYLQEIKGNKIMYITILEINLSIHGIYEPLLVFFAE